MGLGVGSWELGVGSTRVKVTFCTNRPPLGGAQASMNLPFTEFLRQIRWLFLHKENPDLGIGTPRPPIGCYALPTDLTCGVGSGFDW
jgi:hypothetical protein